MAQLPMSSNHPFKDYNASSSVHHPQSGVVAAGVLQFGNGSRGQRGPSHIRQSESAQQTLHTVPMPAYKRSPAYQNSPVYERSADDQSSSPLPPNLTLVHQISTPEQLAPPTSNGVFTFADEPSCAPSHPGDLQLHSDSREHIGTELSTSAESRECAPHFLEDFPSQAHVRVDPPPVQSTSTSSRQSRRQRGTSTSQSHQSRRQRGTSKVDVEKRHPTPRGAQQAAELLTANSARPAHVPSHVPSRVQSPVSAPPASPLSRLEAHARGQPSFTGVASSRKAHQNLRRRRSKSAAPRPSRPEATAANVAEHSKSKPAIEGANDDYTNRRWNMFGPRLTPMKHTSRQRTKSQGRRHNGGISNHPAPVDIPINAPRQVEHATESKLSVANRAAASTPSVADHRRARSDETNDTSATTAAANDELQKNKHAMASMSEDFSHRKSQRIANNAETDNTGMCLLEFLRSERMAAERKESLDSAISSAGGRVDGSTEKSSAHVGNRPSASSQTRSISDDGSASPPSPAVLTAKKREYALKEIVETEKNFLSQLVSMQACTEALRKAIDERPAFNKVPNMKSILELFDALKTIRSVNFKFVQHIKESRITNLKTIPQVFLEFAPYFTHYKRYAAVYEEALSLMDSLQRSSEDFREIVDTSFKKPMGNCVKLDSLLIQPVQRVPRYTLLFRELLKHTHVSHPDHAIIEKSLEVIKSVNSKINYEVFAHLQREKLVAVCQKFTTDTDFIHPSRKFLAQASLERFDFGSFVWKSFEFFLFNDRIACASKRGTRYVLEERLDLSANSKILDMCDVEGEEHEDFMQKPYRFQVASDKEAWMFAAPTEKVKGDWLELIEKFVL